MQTHTSGRVLPIRGGDMMAPATCFICGRPGSNVDEQFADPSELYADPNIAEEFFGSIYFCRSCALEIAAVFGAQSDEEIADTTNQRDSLLVENINLRARLREANDAINSLTSLRNLEHATPVRDFVAGPPISQAKQDSHQGLPELTEQRDDESAVVTESGSSEGSNDTDESASDNTELDDFLRNL